MHQLSTSLQPEPGVTVIDERPRTWHPPRTAREAVDRLLRHKRMMAIYVLGVMGIVSAVTFGVRPLYHSEAKLFVRIGRENLGLDPTTTMGQNGAVLGAPSNREDEINSMVEMFGSRSLLERLADDIGPPKILDRAPDHASWFSFGRAPTASDLRADAVERLRRRMAVSAQKRSNVISVSYVATSPESAQEVVRQLVDLYQDEYARLHRVEGSKQFLAGQAKLLRDRLDAAEARLNALKNTTGLSSVTDQRRILVERVGHLEDALLQAESQLAVTEAEARTLSQRLKTLPSMLETERATGFSNEATDGMRQQLYALQLKEQELLSKYKEDAPAVQEVRRQLEQARQILNGEDSNRTQVRSARNPAFQQLELSYLTGQTTIASVRARRESLRQQLTRARVDLAALTSNEVGLAEAQREVELEEAKYRRYTDTTEQARVDEALEHERLSNIGVVQPATVEPRPVSPRVLLNLVLGFLAAIFGAFGLAVVADYRSATSSRPSTTPFGGAAPEAGRILPVAQIRFLMDRQRIRSDRNGECFAMLIYSWRDKAAIPRCAGELQALLLWRLRTTDDVGWYDENRLGALLHDTEPEAAYAVADDIAARYPQHLPAVMTEVFTYPASDAKLGSGEATGPQVLGRPRRVGNSLIAFAPAHAATGTPTRPIGTLFVRPIPRWKRALDIAVSSVALALTAPILLLAALAIKLDSRGPVIFRQQRSGLGGTPFTIFKLRTMALDAERKKAHLLSKSERDGPFKMKHDPRVTRVGRLLRQTSIDELPQLWNVLNGTMSLVGPRPLPLAETAASAPWQRQRLDVTPGLTGVWQVSGRAQIAFAQWVRMDVGYIRSRSLLQDIKLLLKTIPAVVLRRGAH